MTWTAPSLRCFIIRRRRMMKMNNNATDAPRESSREMSRACSCNPSLSRTILREAPWSAVRSTALGGNDASRKRDLECWSLLQLSGAELALREAIQKTTTRAGASEDSPYRRESHQPWLHGSKLPTGKLEQAPALQISGPRLRTPSSLPKRCFAHALQGASRKVARGWMISSSRLRAGSRDVSLSHSVHACAGRCD